MYLATLMKHDDGDENENGSDDDDDYDDSMTSLSVVYETVRQALVQDIGHSSPSGVFLQKHV